MRQRKREMALLLSGLLLLAACSAPGAEMPTSVPTPEVTIAPTPTSEPTPAPEPTPSPTPEPTPPPPTVAMERPDLTGEWHRTDCHSESSAWVTISEQTAEGFLVEAECYYGAHGGTLEPTVARFIGESVGVMETYGDYEYRTETGPKPPVQFSWEGDTMTITTRAQDIDLGFGANVYIDGTYTRGEPEYVNAGQLDRLLSREEQRRLQNIVEDYDWSVAQVLENGTITTDILCLLDDGRKGRYLSAWYSPNWGYFLEVVLAEDGKTYFLGNVGFYTDDAEATEMPEVVWPLRDDTHDCFTVPTGGKLGTVLVTVERIEGDYEFMNPAKLSVWDPADLSEPIQVMEVDGFTHYYELLDANFDGYMDFAYTWFLAATNKNDSLWLWDEETGTFVYGEDFAGHGLGLDEEAELVYTYMHGSAASGTTEISHWEDGELLCIRRIETHYPKYEGEVVTQLLTVEDCIDGELTEVYRETFGDPNNGKIYEEAERWDDLSYHGS